MARLKLAHLKRQHFRVQEMPHAIDAPYPRTRQRGESGQFRHLWCAFVGCRADEYENSDAQSRGGGGLCNTS